METTADTAQSVIGDFCRAWGTYMNDVADQFNSTRREQPFLRMANVAEWLALGEKLTQRAINTHTLVVEQWARPLDLPGVPSIVARTAEQTSAAVLDSIKSLGQMADTWWSVWRAPEVQLDIRNWSVATVDALRAWQSVVVEASNVPVRWVQTVATAAPEESDSAESTVDEEDDESAERSGLRLTFRRTRMRSEASSS